MNEKIEKVLQTQIDDLRNKYEQTNDLQMQINSLKLEIERVSNIVNIEHSKLNQLDNSFKAHRDRGEIHKREGLE